MIIQHKIVTVPVADQSYDVNCNLTMNVTSVRYKTILKYNNEILNKKNELSEDITLQIITTTTTTTTTTTRKFNNFIYV